MRPLPVSLLALALACSAEHASDKEPAPSDADPLPPLIEPSPWPGSFDAPRADDDDEAPNVVAVTLEAVESEVEIASGHRVRLWTYNGSLPGPTIEARVGDTIRVRLRNSLPEATTIHWHGLRIPAAMDGVMATQAPIQPGEEFTYEFVVEDSGTFWYHPHVRADEQVERGLYGAIVVRDADEPALTSETTVVLDDVLLDQHWQLSGFGERHAMMGRQGNVLLVNGHAAPTLSLPAGGLHRLRFVNSANARYFRLAIASRSFTVLGFDGAKLEAPITASEVLLVPGARVDLAFEGGAAGDTLSWSALSHERGHETGAAADAKLFAMHFEGAHTQVPELPHSLAALPPLADATITRVLKLEEGTATGGAHQGHSGSAAQGPVFSINGQSFPNVEPFQGTLGTIEEWTIANVSMMDHPFHLHGFRFEVIDVNGSTPAYRALQDTINVGLGQVVTLRVPLQGYAGKWMFHCHILEHAERGMMGELDVIEP
jgi:FtsP/CotA-like multicopper oxidase with cupredoxin domain